MLPFLAASLLLLAAAPALGQDQNAPTVTIEPGADIVEGTKPEFVFKRSHANTFVQVNYVLENQGGPWAQQFFNSRTAFTGGETEKRLAFLAAPNDGVDTPSGSVTVKLLAGAGYVVGSPGEATLSVADDNPTSVKLSATGGDINEGESKTLTVSLGRALVAGEQLTVALALGGSAGFGVDYSLSSPNPAPKGVSYENLSSADPAKNPPSLVFTGQDGAADQATLVLEGLTDRLAESSETVTVDLGALTAGTGLDGGAKAAADNVNFEIDDATDIEVEIEAKAATVTEGADAVWTLTADPAPLSDVTVEIDISKTAGAAITDHGSKSVAIKAGKTAAELAVATDGNKTDDLPRSFTAAIEAGEGYFAGADKTAKVHVLDDDPTTVTLEVTDSTAVEDAPGNTAGFTVKLNRKLWLHETLSVPLLFSGGAPGKQFDLVHRGHGDFDAATNTLAFKRGQNLAEFTLAARRDSDDTEDAAIVVDIPKSSAGSPGLGPKNLEGGATGSRTGDGEIVLLDRDRTYRITGGDAVDEGGTATFTVHANRKIAAGALVYVNITQEGDFVESSALGLKVVTVTEGSVSKDLTVQTVGDERDEADGKVIATIARHRSYAVAKPPDNSAAVTVNDDDPPPVAKFDAASAAVAETGTSTTIGVSLSSAPAEAVTLKYTLSGVAALGEDYEIAGASDGAGTLTIPKDAAAASITVKILDDALGEGDETVILTLANGKGYSVGEPGSATLTIDDDEPAVAIAASASAVVEGTAAVFTASSDQSVAAALPVSVEITGDGDFFDDDDIGSRTITIAKGEKTASLSVPTANDDADEGNGWIRATLQDGVAYSIPAPPNHSAQIAVTDDDEPAPETPVAKFDAASATVAETGTSTTIGVSLSPVPPEAITLKYALSGPATLDKDYEIAGASNGAGILAVPKNAAAASITVKILDDALGEGDETVILSLVYSEGYSVAKPDSFTLTIADDDPRPVVSISSGAAVAEGENASFTLTASPAPAANLSVNVTVTQNGAFAAEGQTGARTVTVDATGKTSFAVLTTNDDTDEENGSVTATVNSGEGYAAADAPANSATVAVNDNDATGANPPSPPPPPPTPTTPPAPPPPPTTVVSLAASPNPVQEGEPVTITATLSHISGSNVTIPLVQENVTAEMEDCDMLESISITSNEASGTGIIKTYQDDDLDDETLTISLGPGVTGGATPSIEVTVMDNGAATSTETLDEEIPSVFALEQNYPNPFNPSTTIEFALPEAQRVTLSVYDMLGQLVQVLTDGVQPAGRHSVSFDASDLASGTYLYVLETLEQAAVKTMALLK